MKLKYFSEQTVERSQIGGRSGAVKVTFSKNGTISFSKGAQQLLKLTLKDKVALSQEEEAPENWYIHKDQQHGFQLRVSNDQLTFAHTTLVKKFKELAELSDDKTYSFLIGGQPTIIPGDKAKTEYWGILINR